jgi:hypothetical protein
MAQLRCSEAKPNIDGIGANAVSPRSYQAPTKVSNLVVPSFLLMPTRGSTTSSENINEEIYPKRAVHRQVAAHQ